jgi:cell division protein FtsI (penicillin-binding protein 3)
LLTMAGKTGTCQVDYTTESIQYVSSFVGYFPAEKPKYSCIVVIHKPNKAKGYYGATVAAPVFKRIAKSIYNDTPKAVYLNASSLTALPQQLKAQKAVSVPDLKGLSKNAALKKIEALGLKAEFEGKGTVTQQRPEAGEKVNNQQKIRIKLS